MDDFIFHDAYLHFTLGGVCFVLALAFAVGAAFGSFFNVVAYRFPRGESLNRPGSRCPACGRPIRWYDNVPIFGWLMLGGRCRDCRAAISPRYPLVELLVALASAAVCWSAIAPISEPAGGELYKLNFPLVGFRLLLAYTLLCAALLEFDGHRPPGKLLVTVLAAGIVFPLAWPALCPPPSEAFADRFDECGRVLAATLLLGLLAWPMLIETTDRPGIRDALARIAALGLVGAFLGLPAVAAVAVFAAGFCVVMKILVRFWSTGNRLGWAVGLVIATLIWIVSGNELLARWSQHGGDVMMALVAAGLIVAVLSLFARVARADARGYRA